MESFPYTIEELVDLVEATTPGNEPVEHLAEAVIISGQLGDLADQLVGHYVDEARRAGSSWAEIGESLGVTKQAAQKRFVGGRSRVKGRGMFTRFAASARQVVQTAVAHAHEAGSDHVGTEHLVLGLIDDKESLAARAISALAGSTEDLRSKVLETVAAEATGDGRGHIPFSDDSKKVLELALREAIRARSRHIGTEHVLLGILRAESSAGAGLLEGAGVTRKGADRFITEHSDDST